MKKILVCLLIVLMTLPLVSCGNQDLFDTVYTYDYALVRFPDGGVQRIEIKQWCTYEGEQIQIIAEDGTVYLVNSNNAILVHKE